jgi:UDP-N-acetylmuramate--alanine ligase
MNKKHLHAIGIGGIGVSALARHYRAHGWTVSGCDVVAVPDSDALLGHDASHIERFHPDMVIYSPALPENHPELIAAKNRNIPTYSYPEALGLVAQSYNTVAVSGTHGKSTTTALLTYMFSEAGKDPVAIVGARVPLPGFDINYRNGKGSTFIVEGCEYKRGMLEIKPTSALITNVEADHLDYYKDVTDVTQAFSDYVRALPKDGVLVYNADDPHAKEAAASSHVKKLSFGLYGGDVTLTDINIEMDGMSAVLVSNGKNLGTLETPLLGEFNLMNILAAASMALVYGLPFVAIARAVKQFTGIGRRFEHIGQMSGTSVFSDYAHHPTALQAVVNGAESRFGKGNVLAIFQPHQIDRTQKLRTEFEKVFESIPHLFVPEIYYVKGREDAGDFSANLLVEKVNMHRSEPAVFFPTLESMTETIVEASKKYKAVIFIGAGDIDRFARSLLLKHSS